MNRTVRIQNILSRRQPLVERIKRIEGNLENLQGLLNRFVQEGESFKKDVEDKKIQKIKGLQQSCSEIKSEIAYQLGQLDKLRSRFSRQTLNIGVVGLARQGKSRLLQSMTGLGPMEIPDGNRTDCTGVRSSITDSQGEFSATVSFYSPSSFLDEIISPYFVNLGLGAKPLSLVEFAANPLPDLPVKLQDSAVAKAQYAYLQRYHESYPRYKNLLGEEPRQITREQIREYVSQSSADGNEPFHNFFVVQEVQIQCPFPASDCSDIGFVDMPGLGDTGLGNEDRLLKALAHEVDLLFFIRLPSPSGDSWNETDIMLYDTCARAVSELPLQDWSFMILNRTRAEADLGDNLANCKDLEDQIRIKGSGFSEIVIADCSDQEEVMQKILDPALEYLTAKIEEIDAEYVQKKHDQLLEIRKTINRLFAQATPEKILGAESIGSNEEQQFLDLFEDAWQEMVHRFEQLLNELFQTRDSSNVHFVQSIKEVIEEAQHDTGIPDLEKIERQRAEEKSYDGAFYYFLNEIRAHLSNKFLNLDESLSFTTEEAKQSVSRVLKAHGGLSSLSNAEGTDFLRQLYELGNVPGYDFRLIQDALNILISFKLSFRGLIQHRIRKQMDNLTPDRIEFKRFNILNSLKISLKSLVQREKITNAETLQHYLQDAHQNVLGKIESALKEFHYEPNQAIFAIVEEFTDRAFRAKGVRNQWQTFYRMNRASIWPEQFKKIAQGTYLRQRWQTLVQNILGDCRTGEWELAVRLTREN
ncbi:MAG: hypothetical protein K9K64_06260 [Desulfohalobiaceae bacterium]|nr:hypothetical protein [Desulfohalobiaceae bacterium]